MMTTGLLFFFLSTVKEVRRPIVFVVHFFFQAYPSLGMKLPSLWALP